MSKTLNEMVHTIVDHYDSINQAADEVGVHYNVLKRLLKDETATVHDGTRKKSNQSTMRSHGKMMSRKRSSPKSR